MATQSKPVQVVEDVPVEMIGSAIVAIAEAAKQLERQGLSRRALVVLLKDSTGVSHGDINLILDGLRTLGLRYTTTGGKR